MKNIENIKNRLFDVKTKKILGTEIIFGKVIYPQTKSHLTIGISSSEREGEHVSVSKKKKIPTWEEMCFVKDLCFEDEEIVIQIHPKKSEYVNLHENCLHLWRNVEIEG